MFGEVGSSRLLYLTEYSSLTASRFHPVYCGGSDPLCSANRQASESNQLRSVVLDSSSNDYLTVFARQAIDVIAPFVKVPDGSGNQPSRFSILEMNLSPPVKVSNAVTSFIDLFDHSAQVRPGKLLPITSQQPFRGEVLYRPRSSSSKKPDNDAVQNQHNQSEGKRRELEASSQRARHGQQ